MNYLVHLYLAGEDPDLQLGGLMGDFVKGPLTNHYPEAVTEGLHLHRRIDSLSHSSPNTRASRQRLHPKYGHGRGIIIDIFYDHFLAAHWEEYHHIPLTAYSQKVYALLEKRRSELPEGLRSIAPRMIAHDWLSSYRHPEVVGRALRRIAQRLSRPLPLDEATKDLQGHRTALYGDFTSFLAEARQFACTEMDRDLYP